MWFWLSFIALLCWSGSDLFSKIGCREKDDKSAYLKMVSAVGLVMGLHACYEIFINGVDISFGAILTYLPVSLLYILSMAMGYVGLRFIELSVSSPVCNSSGALVAIVSLFAVGIGSMNGWQLGAIALVCAGVVGLGVVEATEDPVLREARQQKSNYRYAKSWLALALPIAYCILDAAGTYADNVVLQTLNEDIANVAYELTFLAAGVICFVYAYLIRREKLVLKMTAPRIVGAAFETAGQLAYIYAIADEEHLAMAAPMISSYCAVSVIWGRLFLKEKLSWKHYLTIAAVICGIIIMGVFDM